MKEISNKIDELYRNASRKVGDLQAKVNEQVSEYLKTLNGSDAAVVAARDRMADLFNATRNFGVGVRSSRKEMHERGKTLH